MIFRDGCNISWETFLIWSCGLFVPVIPYCRVVILWPRVVFFGIKHWFHYQCRVRSGESELFTGYS